MGLKRRGGKAGGRGGSKKKKKKSKNKLDWYTSDASTGIYGLGRKKVHQAEDEFEEETADEDSDNGGVEVVEEEEEVEVDHYKSLLESINKENVLGATERSILQRVRNEQEGIETYSDDEEDESESESEREDEKVLDGDDQETEESEDEVDENQDEAVFNDYELRFSKKYLLSEDEMENAASKGKEISRTKVKISLSSDGDTKYLAHGYNYRGDMNGIKKKFKPGKINPSNFKRLAHTWELKDRLAKRFVEYAQERDTICKKRLGEESVPKRNKFGLTELQETLLSPLSKYSDVVFSSRTLDNAAEIRELYVLHVLNHVLKSNDLIEKHNVKLKDLKAQARLRRQEAIVEGREYEEPDVEDDSTFRDQGFTRPKALMIVPTRLAALRVMRTLLGFFPANARVDGKDRFFQEFSEHIEESSDEKELRDAGSRIKREQTSSANAYDETYYAAGRHPNIEADTKRRNGASTRPADWHDTFTGNSDECFRIGLTIRGRKSIKLFSDFFRSDIIIASPVGLRMSTGQEVGEQVSDTENGANSDDDDKGLEELGINKKAEEDRLEKLDQEVDTDFLSSIEICTIDQADVLEMQNWQHLVDVFNAINRKVLKLREEMDFSRVRNYMLIDGLARLFRQTMVFSQYPSPFVNSLVIPNDTRKLNMAGIVSFRRASYEPCIEDIMVEDVAHKFVRIEDDESDDDDKRIEYFEAKLMPMLKRNSAAHTLVVVPSYFDYVSVRGLFRSAATELGEEGDRAKGRPWRKQKKQRRRGKDGKPLPKIKEDMENVLFVCASEYTEHDDVARARGDFYHGRARVFLTTERFLFYNRFRIRGIRRVVCFAPPVHAHFYSELSNLIGSGLEESSTDQATNLVLFNTTDSIPLERIVGSRNAKQMLSDKEKTVFNFEAE
uniref:U3 small nucleolar RNA-associated protein 25 n=1 Tax=Mucochytrium quahogii TaxID=96639 RepID=A0A7S2SMD6_9STRA|mmetsp:Transcript_823/g.1592  ORF Transcript_823/g.1592 Transcript_823/m.1592 type:complete len:899 (+) Transcript_823:51-2747(+)